MYILCSMLDLPTTHVTTTTIGSACPVSYEIMNIHMSEAYIVFKVYLNVQNAYDKNLSLVLEQEIYMHHQFMCSSFLFLLPYTKKKKKKVGLFYSVED